MLVSVYAIQLHLNEKIGNCVVYQISDSPLAEWHSFACIPNNYDDGSSRVISNADDWTRKTINNPEELYYIRGIPTIGVLCMARYSKKWLLSPLDTELALSRDHDKYPRTKCRILWSAPSPRHTFGNDICDKALEVDSKAVVIDPHTEWRKDLVAIAYALYLEEGAEAIFCIGNQSLIRKVIYELGSRGIPTFGPIWDS